MDEDTRKALFDSFVTAEIDFQEMALYLHNISKSDEVI